MPYLGKKQIPFRGIISCIAAERMQKQDISRITEKCPKTVAKKYDEPGEFTLNELKALHKKGHIPIEDLMGAIRKGFTE